MKTWIEKIVIIKESEYVSIVINNKLKLHQHIELICKKKEKEKKSNVLFRINDR